MLLVPPLGGRYYSYCFAGGMWLLVFRFILNMMLWMMMMMMAWGVWGVYKLELFAHGTITLQ